MSRYYCNIVAAIVCKDNNNGNDDGRMSSISFVCFQRFKNDFMWNSVMK